MEPGSDVDQCSPGVSFYIGYYISYVVHNVDIKILQAGSQSGVPSSQSAFLSCLLLARYVPWPCGRSQPLTLLVADHTLRHHTQTPYFDITRAREPQLFRFHRSLLQRQRETRSRHSRTRTPPFAACFPTHRNHARQYPCPDHRCARPWPLLPHCYRRSGMFIAFRIVTCTLRY